MMSLEARKLRCPLLRMSRSCLVQAPQGMGLFAFGMLLCMNFQPSSAIAEQASIVCHPAVSDIRVVASAGTRQRAGALAQPPLSDQINGFAWPDSPLGVASTADGLAFFGSDGGSHYDPDSRTRHGSIVRSIGTLDDPLGSDPVLDVQIRRNPDPTVNPSYDLYSYFGGGPVFRIPAGSPGAGKLLMVTHGEIRTPRTQPRPSFYTTLGLAASTDEGRSWTDLGEIIRPQHPYEPDMPGFEDGDPPLALTADGRYLMIFYHDLQGHGAWRPQDIAQLAVARASLMQVASAAFGPTPHAAPFQKYFEGYWSEAGIGGRVTDLAPPGMFGAERQVAYDTPLHRYLMIVGKPAYIGLSESADALHWTSPITLADFSGQQHAIYASMTGTGSDPTQIANEFYVFYTWYPTNGASWRAAELRRLSVQCK